MQPDDVTIKFTNEAKLACEGALTLQECTAALKYFKLNKSPGCDGLPAEFYVEFWQEIGDKLAECLNFGLARGTLALSQRRGVITLLEKKGKDNTLIKNWRPVSLLNTDYKILTKVLSRRLEKHIPSVINPDQSGFVSGRYIGENIRFIEDLVEKFDREEREGLILQLDFEKAFDSVEWDFMIETLKAFNLGKEFISYVKCCYTDIYSCVCNNGFTTNWFKLFRGMRQGCPLSCLLFILCAEIMSNRIRNNQNIHGVKIGIKEHKLKQFADDCSCFLRDIPSIYTLIETIKGFSSLSGLNLNAGKSVLFFLGPWKNKDINLLDMVIERTTINILGISISRCKKQKLFLNFEDKIPKMKTQLQMYSSRDLNICGRILITMTFGISRLLYPLSILESDREFQKSL